MNLRLHESILLLSLDDEKGYFRSSLAYVNYGFAAAILIELMLENRIRLEDKRLHIITNALTDDKVLNQELSQLQNAKKPPKMNRWLHRMAQRNAKPIKKTIEQLIQQGILKQTKKKILWIFTVKRYPSVNLAPENHLRHRLRDIIFEGQNPTEKEHMLLALVEACQFVNELVPEKDKRKEAKAALKVLSENSDVKKLIGNAIAEMQAAVTASTTVVT